MEHEKQFGQSLDSLASRDFVLMMMMVMWLWLCGAMGGSTAVEGDSGWPLLRNTHSAHRNAQVAICTASTLCSSTRSISFLSLHLVSRSLSLSLLTSLCATPTSCSWAERSHQAHNDSIFAHAGPLSHLFSVNSAVSAPHRFASRPQPTSTSHLLTIICSLGAAKNRERKLLCSRL